MIERGARREIGNRVLLELAALGLRAALALALVGCAGAYRPQSALPPASTSGESVIGQIGDEQLTLRLREGLTAKGLTPAVSPYVYMAHAFLVGRVDSAKRVEQALEVAAGVQGLASIDSYVVVRQKGARTAGADDPAIQGTARVMLDANPAARAGHVDVVSIDGHIVLLGVVPSAEARASVEVTARGVGGVTGVTNFLLLPERQ